MCGFHAPTGFGAFHKIVHSHFLHVLTFTIGEIQREPKDGNEWHKSSAYFFFKFYLFLVQEWDICTVACLVRVCKKETIVIRTCASVTWRSILWSSFYYTMCLQLLSLLSVRQLAKLLIICLDFSPFDELSSCSEHLRRWTRLRLDNVFELFDYYQWNYC